MANIGIVGAGVCGLTTALAIARTRCHQVTLYDKAESTHPTSLKPALLPPNASRVLKALGLNTALADHAARPQMRQILSPRSGFALSQLPLGDLAQARYSAPYLSLSRSVLMDLLKAQIAETASVRYSHQCTAVNATTGELTFDQNRRAQHDLILAADGPRSFVRQSLSMAPSCSPIALACCHGVVDDQTQLANQATSRQMAQTLSFWLGPGQQLSHWPIGTDQLAFQAVVPMTNQLDQAAEQFAAWHPFTQRLIRAASTYRISRCQDLPTMVNWCDQRVALLGNAAHPLLPFSDQDTAVGIEDAWVISRMLEQHEQDLDTAIRQYQRYRTKRCTQIQQYCRQQARTQLTNNRQDIWRRNFGLSLGSRFLPEMALAKFDWLYSYDCVRGFY